MSAQVGGGAPLEDAGIWKAWIVLCVSEASRMGLAPIASSQLHVLLYLANTLAPFFDVARVRGRVLKRGTYPFYPDVQREFDRMAFAGILSIEQVDFGPKGVMTAHYSATDAGMAIRQLLLAQSLEADRTARLFRELVSACFGKFLGTNAEIGAVDANYGSRDVMEGQVVDFSEWQDENKNAAVARYLIEELRAMQPRVDRDGVRLYCDYLDQALAVA